MTIDKEISRYAAAMGISIEEAQERRQKQMRPRIRVVQGNPMVTQFGPDAQGRACAACKHLLRFVYNNTYFKCQERGVTHGHATDHRKKWPACRLFEEAQCPDA